MITPEPRMKCSNIATQRRAPWYEVPADNKKKARLNCIHHILSQIPYKEVKPVVIKLPERPEEKYNRPPLTDDNFVPETVLIPDD